MNPPHAEQLDWRQPVFYQDTPLERLVIEQIQACDPEIMNDPQLAVYGYVGAAYIRQITEAYGTPARPLWHEGSNDATFMTFHNGQSPESSGHTSMDPEGFGVPHNALIMTRRINTLAREEGRPEPVNPLQRARLLGAACAHDYIELCGRSIHLPDRSVVEKSGDEYMSSRNAFITFTANGVSNENAEQIAVDILATQCDPATLRQLIDYSQPEASIFEQEILAGSDLVSGVRYFSPWTNLLYSVELCGAELKTAMDAEQKQPSDFPTIKDILRLIGRHPALHQAFNNNVLFGPTFVDKLNYQDSAIRRLANTDIERIFAHSRSTTSSLTRQVSNLVESGRSPLQIYEALNIFER